MFSRRGAKNRDTETNLKQSKKERFPALKKQLEIDLEHLLYETEEPDEDSFLGSHEDAGPGPFGRLPLASEDES